MNETPGVLLLTGAWGCGKSHLMKEIVNENNQNSENTEEKCEGNKSKSIIVMVSLFGIDSIPDLDKAVKKEILKCKYGINEKKEKLTKRAVAGAGSLLDIVGSIIPAVSAAKPLMSINLLDFVEITNKIGANRLVLVFDDFERCNNIQRDVLLGYINDLSENKQIKVIIITDETKLQEDERYTEYKEKIISRTIYLDNNYNTLICQIVDAYKETEPGYQSFLRNNVNLLQQVFAESQKNNIRILKYILADFERIYAAWQSTEISCDNLPFVLYTFAAEYYIKRQPQKEEPPKEQKGLLYSYERAEDKQYPLKGSHSSSFYSVSAWIKSGTWDEDQFKTELCSRYGKTELNPVQAFLWKNFWDLTQIEIEQGLPILVQHAYNGELSHDNMTTFLSKIHALNSAQIPLPCEINYERILEGLWIRLNNIKSGIITEPRISSVASPENIDDEAKPINVILEQMEDYIGAFNTRRDLLAYLVDPRFQSRRALKSYLFFEFDNEMREVFIREYTKAGNGMKRDLAASLISIQFFYSALSKRTNIECSIHNYVLLKEEVGKLMSISNDYIEQQIHKSFIEKIDERMKELEVILSETN